MARDKRGDRTQEVIGSIPFNSTNPFLKPSKRESGGLLQSIRIAAPESDCCIPDTDCADCRHYAAGSAIVSSRLGMHLDSERQFRGWLDYGDTYLAVWILGYTRGENLYLN